MVCQAFDGLRLALQLAFARDLVNAGLSGRPGFAQPWFAFQG